MGNESVPADNITLKRLVLQGTNPSYDRLISEHNFENSDYESWGILDEKGNLTNAGAILADESPIRHSRVFCTRWNGLDKAHGLMDAILKMLYLGKLLTKRDII